VSDEWSDSRGKSGTAREKNETETRESLSYGEKVEREGMKKSSRKSSQQRMGSKKPKLFLSISSTILDLQTTGVLERDMGRAEALRDGAKVKEDRQDGIET